MSVTGPGFPWGFPANPNLVSRKGVLDLIERGWIPADKVDGIRMLVKTDPFGGFSLHGRTGLQRLQVDHGSEPRHPMLRVLLRMAGMIREPMVIDTELLTSASSLMTALEDFDERAVLLDCDVPGGFRARRAWLDELRKDADGLATVIMAGDGFTPVPADYRPARPYPMDGLIIRDPGAPYNWHQWGHTRSTTVLKWRFTDEPNQEV